MKRFLLLVIFFVGVLSFAYVQLGPARAGLGIYQSLKDQDSERLDKYIDFDSVREHLKEQVNEQVIQKNKDTFENPMVQLLFSGVSLSLTDTFVDEILEPKNLELLFVSPALNKADESTKQDSGRNIFEDIKALPGNIEQTLEIFDFTYTSWSHFEVSMDNQDSLLGGTRILFQRKGINWFVIAIDLPDAVFDSYF